MPIRVLTTPVPGHRRDDASTAEPLTFGVPLPRGFVRDPSNWTLGSTAADGRAESQYVQTRVLDRWSDASARWVLVDAQVNPGQDGRNLLHLDTSAAAGTVPAPLKVAEAGGAVVVKTGPAKFELKPGTDFPFTQVAVGGGVVVGPGACRLSVVGRNGTPSTAVVSRVSVHAAGPLRTVVRVEGRLDVEGRALAVTAHAHFFAGRSAVRLQLTVTNTDRAEHQGGFWDLGDAGSLLLKDLSIHIALVAGAGGAEASCSPEAGLPFGTVDLPFEIYQDSSGGEYWQSTNHINRERRIPVTFRGYRMKSGASERSGLRATPIVRFQADRRAAAASIPRFWQNFPCAMEATAEGLILRMWPGQFGDLHELQGGEQKTFDCWLSFDGEDSLEWTRTPVLACVDPEWTVASGTIPFLAPLAPNHRALVDAAIEGPNRFEIKRETIDEYGWRHFGEIYGDHESVRQKSPPLVSHYNNQYDPLAGFILQYLRTGDRRWWAMADELASHVVDIDVYHTDRDKSAYNHGLFWHTFHYGDADLATHRTYPAAAKGRTHGGGPSADHNYTTGLMLHYFLTGSHASRQTVIDLAQYVIDLDDGRKTVFRWFDRGDTGRAILSAGGYFGPGRGPANSLNALVDGYRLSGDDRFRRKADQMVRRVVHPQQDIAALRLDVPESRWFYTMFLQSLGKHLHDRIERDALDETYSYGRESLLHLARWMAEHEYPYLERPEKLEFPTETWAAQDIRKSDIFSFAASHADGDERALFQERARFFHDYSTRTLAESETRGLARPIVVLLTSGHLCAARERPEWRAAAPAGPPLRDVAPEARFVPQRTRAVQRAKIAAVAAFVVAAGLVLAMVL